MELQVDKVIEELSKIDVATEKVINSADKEKKDYAEEIEQKTKEFDQTLINEMNDRLDLFRQSSKDNNKKILSQYRNETEKLLSRLDESYEKNHKIWSEQILKQLIRE